MQSVYTSKHGLQAQQRRLDIIASNIANVGTVGYKSQRADFKDALYTRMIDPSDTGSTANLQQGAGVLVSSAYRDFSAGVPVQTGETLDLYIEGEGFFTVQDSGGEVLYTRNGALSVSVEESGQYLVTADGYYMLDENGNRIVLPEDYSSLSVTQYGVMGFGDGTARKLGLVMFINKDGLSLTGGGCYAATEASGEAKPGGATVKQGYLESSNVDISEELTRLIRTQRAYSLAGKALTTWDEMESATYNIR